MEHSELEALKKLLDNASEIVSDMLENRYDTTPGIPEFYSDTPFMQNIHALYIQLQSLLSEVHLNQRSIGETVDGLTELAAGMRTRSGSLSKETDAVSAATGEMSQNMNVVSSAADELSVTMNQVSGQVNDSMENIRQVNQSMGEMSDSIDQVAGKSETVRNVVIDAVEGVQRATERIEALNKRAADIGQVTGSISGISDQTKLLALNATIEAARAGEAGVRFGVVAREVKALAGETSRATASIRKQVEAIREGTTLATGEIRKINDIMSQVQSIVLDIAGAVLQQSNSARSIAGNVDNTSLAIAEITRAVNESAQAVAEVTRNITQAAVTASEIDSRIGAINRESTELSEDALVLYAGAMGVQSHSGELTRLMEGFQLPQTLTDDVDTNAFFRFSSRFSVKVEAIDEEHRKIFDFVNLVYRAIKNRENRDGIVRTLGEMASFVTEHFAHEEHLMDQTGFAGLDAHKEIHEKLLSDVAAILQQLQQEEAVDLIGLMGFLRDWLIKHIMGVDRKYSATLNEHGIY